MLLLIENTVEPGSWAPEEFGGLGTGEGTITAYPTQQPKKLAILQTREIHKKIEKLLSDMRKSLGHQVAIEARFLLVTENFLEDIGLDVDFNLRLGGKWWHPTVGALTGEQYPGVTFDQASSGTVAFDVDETGVAGSLSGIAAAATIAGGYGTLDDLQVSFLIRAVQAHRDATSLTAPKIAVLSGESATFNITRIVPLALPPIEPGGAFGVGVAGGVGVTGGTYPREMYIPTGSVLNITPTITQDKKNVLLNIVTNLQEYLGTSTTIINTPVTTTTDAQGTITTTGGPYEVVLPETESSSLMTRVSVPDGGTLLLGGQKITKEVEMESGVPILSKLPIIGRMFSNRSKIKDHKILLILVKPTIILQEEAEAEAIAAMEGVF
jgi:general secretion pathway protein D